MQAVEDKNKVESADLKHLKEQQAQIKKWMSSVHSKIYELETAYLEETHVQGNIVKGWEVDGRPPLKPKAQCEDKERLFTYSSHEMWLDNKNQQEAAVAVKLTAHGIPKKKPGKKRKSEAVSMHDWDAQGDY